jgi:cyclophilin family peptidyl-prolyl cis-trans isomerase
MRYTITLIIISILFLIVWILTVPEKEENNSTPMPMPEKIAHLETSLGDIKILLYTEELPITTENFINLIEKGFYTETGFHRIIPGFMIQGGDPFTKDDTQKMNWGTGGPGYTIKDEFGTKGNKRGTIAMANAGPNTGGSQFFINVVDNTFLDDKHPVFGEVIEGMDVADALVALPRDERDAPLTLPKIIKASIIEK